MSDTFRLVKLRAPPGTLIGHLARTNPHWHGRLGFAAAGLEGFGTHGHTFRRASLADRRGKLSEGVTRAVILAAGGLGRQPTILVAEDDPRMQLLVQSVLRAEGFGVITASDGDIVVGLVKRHRPDALVLDLKMPRVSGLEALRALRSAGEDVPVIILTGVSDEDGVLDAFEAGADDYVIKPFLPRILLARLRAVLRRRELSPDENAALAEDGGGDVALDPRTRDARVHGRVVKLTPTEYQLLRTLIRGAGRVFTPSELLARVWGPTYVGQDDIIRANIYRLRHKLEPEPGRPRYIQGRRGAGYFFSGGASDRAARSGSGAVR